MGQSLSKDKRKGKGKGKGKKTGREGLSPGEHYEIRHPQWVFQDPASSDFCYSPIHTSGRRIQIQITSITDENPAVIQWVDS
ncbi:hypothetical protein F5Y13DRAFT_192452 [Hypoxylon sp. FL1857]|nr:hypothetical protein F5Y13DRAFT_192452 [Hypoxylon sp. FL1857]